MSYRLYSDEEKRLQRKLIPLNLIVALLALVAAVSLIITPLLKIDIGKLISAFGSLSGESIASEEGESSEGSEGSEGGSSSTYTVLFENIDAEIELAPLDMLKVLIAPENEKGLLLIDNFIVKNGILETLLSTFVNFMIAGGTGAIESESDFDKLDLSALNSELKKLDNAKSEADVATALDGYLAILEQQLDMTLTADMKDAAKENTVELYKKTVAATGGSFSVEKMLCVNFAPEGFTYASYSDLVKGLFNGDFASSDNDMMSGISEYLDMVNQLAAPYGYLFIFVAFHVLMWFILFLFAFFRIFAKNKRFTMWYVKLVSCWPCIIFFLLPFAMSKAAVGIEMLAPFAGVFAAITSMTWISGICYLVLWALSICWAFPIKHKIRKIRKGRA